MENNNINFAGIIIYPNAERDKKQILKENKGKAGIYMWKHLESGRIYIGSASDLTDRLTNYFNKSNLKLADNYISRALLLHGYGAFSLAIIEYIDVSGLSFEEARELIIAREQSYLDIIFSREEPNTYNLLQKADSSLGFKHTVETLAKLRGRVLSEETKALMSTAKTAGNNPMFGESHSAESIAKMRKPKSEETRAKMSAAKTAENNPMSGKTGELNPMFGKSHSTETIAKIAETKFKKVFLYSNGTPPMLELEFISCTDAAIHFNCCNATITRYLDKKGKIFQEKWILSSSIISNE